MVGIALVWDHTDPEITLGWDHTDPKIARSWDHTDPEILSVWDHTDPAYQICRLVISEYHRDLTMLS